MLGQDQDNFIVIPLSTYLTCAGPRNSLTLNVESAGRRDFERRRMRRAMSCGRAATCCPDKDEDFFVGTKDSYIAYGRASAPRFLRSSSW